MPLLYDSFGIRRVELIANLWPDFESFMPGELSRLLGALNEDDIFTGWDLRPQTGARFEGDEWLYDISTSSLLVSCRSYSSVDSLRSKVRSLLGKTRIFFTSRHRLAFYTDEIRVVGFVPEEKGRDVGEVVQKRLLARVSKEDRDELPGLGGAGLRLVGDAPDSEGGYHWHASIEPPHGAYDSLGLSAQLMFPISPDPPRPGPDLEVIDHQLETAYNFVNDSLRTFSGKLFT